MWRSSRGRLVHLKHDPLRDSQCQNLAQDDDDSEFLLPLGSRNPAQKSPPFMAREGVNRSTSAGDASVSSLDWSRMALDSLTGTVGARQGVSPRLIGAGIRFSG